METKYKTSDIKAVNDYLEQLAKEIDKQYVALMDNISEISNQILSEQQKLYSDNQVNSTAPKQDTNDIDEYIFKKNESADILKGFQIRYHLIKSTHFIIHEKTIVPFFTTVRINKMMRLLNNLHKVHKYKLSKKFTLKDFIEQHKDNHFVFVSFNGELIENGAIYVALIDDATFNK